MGFVSIIRSNDSWNAPLSILGSRVLAYSDDFRRERRGRGDSPSSVLDRLDRERLGEASLSSAVRALEARKRRAVPPSSPSLAPLRDLRARRGLASLAESSSFRSAARGGAVSHLLYRTLHPFWRHLF